MRRAIGAMLLLCAAASASAQAKDCEELKAEIDAKIRGNGAVEFTLTIVAKDADAGDARVVGTCGGGTQKILYRRSAAAPTPAVESARGT